MNGTGLSTGRWAKVRMMDDQRGAIDSRVAGALILGVVGTAFWLGVHAAVPGTADRPATIAYFAAILAGIGLLLLVSPRGGTVILLAVGLAWRLVEPRLWAVLGGVLGSRIDGLIVGGSDLLETYTPLLVGTATFALAVWRRPPRRTADGRPILGTRAVNWLAASAILLGPPLGLFAWLVFAPGDIYGRPLGVGLLVGGFGLLLFTSYSGFWRLVTRPLLAAALAASWSVAALALLLLA
jgi:hypothetical protein